MRFSVDPWDPSYGASIDSGDLEPSGAEVNVEVEAPEAEWRALAPPPGTEPPEVILFVDGVRRVEARVWIDGDHGRVEPGICASFAAGAVRCDGAAHVAEVEVGRGLFSASAAAEAIVTRHAEFAARAAAGSTPEALSLALQERMAQCEVAVAERCGPAGLIVVDGPLRGRQHLPGAIGYVKTHHVQYLPNGLNAVVGALAPGERTPVFTMRTAWSRHSWYVRLPGSTGSPWSGVVRCEATADLTPTEAVALAHLTAAVLPRFASEGHKDPRAPQNLLPIGGLERELRRRLGDPQVIYRALRTAAASVVARSGAG